ncbi:DUF4044 domain-containing protein [Enterococcus sp. LJL98]
MNEEKKSSTFSKITKVVVWLMLIIMIGSAALGVLSAL